MGFHGLSCFLRFNHAKLNGFCLCLRNHCFVFLLGKQQLYLLSLAEHGGIDDRYILSTVPTHFRTWHYMTWIKLISGFLGMEMLEILKFSCMNGVAFRGE